MFIEAARWHRLGPLLHVRLAPVAATLPPLLAGALQAEYRQHALWGVALATAAGRVLHTLTAAGIEPVVLKGMAMGEVLYHNLALRPTTDLDLLVPHADVSKVKTALLALGFSQELAVEERPHLAGEVALRASLLAGELRFGVDVHWRLAQHPAVMTHLAAEDWLPRSVPARIAGVKVRVLCPEDALLHAAIHLFWHHLGTWHLGWLSDVDTLLRTHGASWDWTALAARAQALRVLLPLQASLRLAHTWFNTPLPERAAGRAGRRDPRAGEAAAFSDLDRQRRNSLASVRGAGASAAQPAGAPGLLARDAVPTRRVHDPPLPHSLARPAAVLLPGPHRQSRGLDLLAARPPLAGRTTRAVCQRWRPFVSRPGALETLQGAFQFRGVSRHFQRQDAKTLGRKAKHIAPLHLCVLCVKGAFQFRGVAPAGWAWQWLQRLQSLGAGLAPSLKCTRPASGNCLF